MTGVVSASPSFRRQEGLRTAAATRASAWSARGPSQCRRAAARSSSPPRPMKPELMAGPTAPGPAGERTGRQAEAEPRRAPRRGPLARRPQGRSPSMEPAGLPPTTRARGRSTAERLRPAAAARLEPVQLEPPTRVRQAQRAPRFGAPPRREPERPAVAPAPMRPERPTRGRQWAVERKREQEARREPARPNRLVPAPELPRAAAPTTERQGEDSMKARPTLRVAPMRAPAGRVRVRAVEHPTTGLAPPPAVPRAIPTSEMR